VTDVVGPWLWLVAGPNGAGKSTYVPRLPADISQIIMPDEIARAISPGAPEAAALSAGRLARSRMLGFLEERRNFAVETTLSGELHLRVARRAKSEGWNVGLVYIGLRTPQLAVLRVLQRHRAGGHTVPVADIVRRYERSLRNLSVLFPLADEALVFDNSSAARPMKKVLVAQEGRVSFRTYQLPRWLRTALGSTLAPSRVGPRT
jgi:predicted ABC-type ATPase